VGSASIRNAATEVDRSAGNGPRSTATSDASVSNVAPPTVRSAWPSPSVSETDSGCAVYQPAPSEIRWSGSAHGSRAPHHAGPPSITATRSWPPIARSAIPSPSKSPASDTEVPRVEAWSEWYAAHESATSRSSVIGPRTT
jgi:hypothetical protein